MARVLSDEMTLSRRRRSLARESSVLSRRLWPAEAILAALLLAAAAIASAAGRLAGGWLVAGGVAGFLAFAHRLKARQDALEVQFLNAGLEGERRIARHPAEREWADPEIDATVARLRRYL